MKKSGIIRVLVLMLGVTMLIGGCSSVDKARKLHRSGDSAKALEMAAALLDDDEDLNTRLGAISLLEEIGGNRAGEILLPVLDDDDPQVIQAAARSIGKIGYGPASGKLISIGMTARGKLFETAAAAIRDMGSPAIDLLVKQYSATSNPSEQQGYKTLMLAVGPSVASGIAKNLAGKSYFENRTNFELLITFQSPQVAEWLLKEIGNNEVAEAVMEGLVKVGSRAVDPVMEALASTPADGENAEIRVRMITVLGQLKARKAVRLLEDLSRDNQNKVREAADLALRRIRGF